MDRVRLAIVGCGTISRLNVPGYLQDDRCEVVALCDPIRERAEESATEWRISPAIYTDYEDVLTDPNVDAVELLTPTHLHADQIIEGLGGWQARVVAKSPLQSPSLRRTG